MSSPPSASDRVVLDYDEAVEMLPEGDAIHTFRQTALCLVGADWTRQQVLDAIARFGAERSGPAATAAKHGMVLKDELGHVFIATREVTPSAE